MIVDRESHLLQRQWLLWWCSLGYSRSTNLSVIPECHCWSHSQQIFYHHVPMVSVFFLTTTFCRDDCTNDQVMAPARSIEANRRRTFTCASVESKGVCSVQSARGIFLIQLHQLYQADRAHRMPIITPAYPAMCATHNVTASTQMIVTEEFKKGIPSTLVFDLGSQC